MAATKLFPGCHGVYLGSQNANVRDFHNLHEEFLDFIEVRDVDVDVHQSAVVGHLEAERGHALGAREDDGEGIRLPRHPGPRPATPQVHDLAPAMEGRETATAGEEFSDAGHERVAGLLLPGGALRGVAQSGLQLRLVDDLVGEIKTPAGVNGHGHGG